VHLAYSANAANAANANPDTSSDTITNLPIVGQNSQGLLQWELLLPPVQFRGLECNMRRKFQ
jgi:hypothetical protein